MRLVRIKIHIFMNDYIKQILADLPSYNEVEERIKAGHGTVLDHYIQEHEPAHPDDEAAFRQALAEVIYSVSTTTLNLGCRDSSQELVPNVQKLMRSLNSPIP